MDIPYTDINIRKLILDGHEKQAAKRRESEAQFRGLLRAGSSGCFVRGTILGSCHRIAHGRWLGHDKPTPPDRTPMFQGGEANETLWAEALRENEGWEVLQKQDAQQGLVFGHPDLVLARDGQPQLVLELKQISSNWSAIYRELEGDPDSKHLIQSATYMWLTGKPAVLCYTSRSDYSVEFARKKYGVTKVNPFYRMFYLAFKEDYLYYRDEYQVKEVRTSVTGQGIKAYYDYLAEMGTTKDLGPRPSNDHVNGSPAAWDMCDPKYCQFAEVCDKYEKDYPTWVDAFKQVCEEKV